MAANQQDFLVKHGMTVRNTATISTVDGFLTTGTYSPVGRPTLSLNFITSDILDSRISFNRTSIGSYVGKDGLIKYAANNAPRFDYDSVNTGTAKGLLIEEARTNLFTYSSSLQTNWSAGNGTKILNATLAPDGTPTALKFVEASTSSYKEISQGGFAYTAGTTYTVSIFAKAAERSKFRIGITTEIFGAGTNIYFDTLAATVTSYTGGYSTGTVVKYANGWVRCSGTFTPTLTTTSNMSFWVTLTNPSEGYTGDGVSGMYFWGAQAESSLFPTSFIPTGAAAVARSSDFATITGNAFNQFFNPIEGSFVAEFDTIWSGGLGLTSDNPGVIGINDQNYVAGASSYNGHAIRLTNNTTVSGIGYGTRSSKAVSISTTVYPNLGGYIQAGTVYKVVGSYNSTSTIELMAQGLYASGSNSTFGHLVFNRLDLGYHRVGGAPSPLGGHLRKISYYPQRLPVIQQRYLTSATVTTSTSFADITLRSSRTASTSNFVVQQGVVVQRNLEVPDVDKYYVTTQIRPTDQPNFNLNFLDGTLDPRVNFSRNGLGSYVGPDGYVKYAAPNVPRFEYSSTSTGTALGLLVEETRTNVMTYSSDFTFSSYVKNSNPVLTTSSYLAPDGTMNATIITSSGVAGSGLYRFPQYITSGTNTTYSIFIKNISGTTSFNFGADANPGTGTANFNIATGTINSNGASVLNSTMTPFKDGWYRISVSFIPTASNPSYVVYPAAASVMTFAIWGAQVESGNFPTSYIPTSASTATRALEIVNVSGQNFNSWINLSAGTLYIEADSIIAAGDTTGQFRWPLSLSQDYGQKIGFWKAPGSNSFYYKMADDAYASRFEGPMSTITTGTAFKAAIAYQSGSMFAVLNAANSATSVVTTIPAQLINNLRIGNGDQPWCGHIRRIMYYPVRLSNTATQALTAL